MRGPAPLFVAPLLRTLQAERPITRVRTPVGDEAWLVTRHKEVKELLEQLRIRRNVLTGGLFELPVIW